MRRWPWLALVLLLLLSSVGAVAQQPPRQTLVIIEALPEFPIGSPIDITVALRAADGSDLGSPGNEPMEIYVNGLRARRARTDADGRVSVRLEQALPLGTHELKARFVGTRDYAASENHATLIVRPARLTIQTVPPLAGIPFAVGGQLLTSDVMGAVRVELTERRAIEVAVLLKPGTMIGPDTRATFDRWRDAVFTPSRTIEFSKEVELQVGFALEHRVQIGFYGLTGEPVNWSRIEAVIITGSDGSRMAIRDSLPHWFKVNRVARGRERLEPTQIQYSVESVLMDGTNVVNRYQQRFFVEADATWNIELLLYFARFSARDAVFGFPIGRGVALTYPNGRVEKLSFQDDTLSVGPLARGLYRVRVEGAFGVAPATPIALSRDQVVELKVLSAIDIGIGLALGLLLAMGLLFYGRPHLLGLGGRRASAALLDDPTEPPRGRSPPTEKPYDARSP